MSVFTIKNFSPFKKHLQYNLHIVRPGENAEVLLRHNANFNKENLPSASRWKTCFLKPKEDGFGYTPVCKDDEELRRLIQEAVFWGHKSLKDIRTGLVKATYRFERYIGVYSSQGLGMAMSTIASEKNRELLFIGYIFYKQWHLCVLFYRCFEGTTSWKSQILISSKKPHFRYGKN